MPTPLKIDQNNEYNTALVIFFVPYCLGEIPSNIFLKRLRPHVWLSGCMFFFGLITICQGLVVNYGGLLAARFFLGLAETGMFPGCFYLIGMWYKRHEAQRRYSFFFSSTTLAGAFGGLLASAIGKMDGLRGYKGWRWIFIIEGTATCLISLILFFTITDFPEDAKWLSTEERAFVKARLQADQGRSAVERTIALRDVGRIFRDFKVLLGGLMYFGLIVPAYGYAYFSPTIIKGYGYGQIEAQLHSVPPWAAAFAMTTAYLSDRARHRFGFVIACTAVAIAGFAMLLGIHDNLRAQYAALFLCAMGAYSAMPIIVCWFNMNLGGHHRRAVGTAWQVGFGNTGGIIAVYAFLKKDRPWYVPGYSISVAFCCLSILASVAYFFACLFQNREREGKVKAGVADDADGAHAFGGAADEEAERRIAEKGDLALTYRYLL